MNQAGKTSLGLRVGIFMALLASSGLTMMGAAGASGDSLSCSAAGYCTIGGSFVAAKDYNDAFVETELGGKAQAAIEVPGIASLDVGRFRYASVADISCSGRGDCSLGGSYAHGNLSRAYVASESNGKWVAAREVSGVAANGLGGEYMGSGAGISSISCTAPGTCGGIGYFNDANTNYQAFVISQTNGVWSPSVVLPGYAQLNVGGGDEVRPSLNIVCTSLGNCNATGNYTDQNGDNQIFVASEANGTWGSAVELPGYATLNVDPNLSNGGGYYFGANTNLSCYSAGSCALGGFYVDASGANQAFVANEVNGTWQNAIEVPGTSVLNVTNSKTLINSGAVVEAVSCVSSGECTAVGHYTDENDVTQAFITQEVDGTWQNATEIPGTSVLLTGKKFVGAGLSLVDCTTPGNCSAGGSASYFGGSATAFVLNEVNGVWGHVTPLRGVTGPMVSKQSGVDFISCYTAGNCELIGGFQNARNIAEEYVARETAGHWGNTVEVPGFQSLNAGATPD